MNTPVKKITLGIIVLLFIFTFGCAQKYAVLVSTNKVTSDDVMIHSEWWYDLFLQYQMLIDNGFEDDKIYVVYGDGSDFNTSHSAYNATTQFGYSITDMAVNKANIQSVFTTLSSIVDKDDYLYVWWMGHGGGSGADSCDLSMSISNTGETVTDTEFATYLNNIPSYNKRSVAIMTCHSGGLLDNLNSSGTDTVVMTSSTCLESSYDASSTCNSILHADFNYTEPNALREQDPCGSAIGSDYNSDSFVSLSETDQYNSATVTTSSPQIADADAIASTTYIEQSSP